MSQEEHLQTAVRIVLHRLREVHRRLQSKDLEEGYFPIAPFTLAATVWEGEPPETASPDEKLRFQALYAMACAALGVPVHAADLRPLHERSAEKIDNLYQAYSWIGFAVSLREKVINQHMDWLEQLHTLQKAEMGTSH